MAKFRPIWSHWLQPITWLTVSRPNEMSEIEFTLLLGSGGQPCKHSLNKVKSLCYVTLNKFSFCNCSYLAWLTTSADSPSLNNGPSPTSFWFTFSVFFKQTSMNFFTTNWCEKCPSSILCRDSNPRPSEHESPPISTRPGFKPSHVGTYGTYEASKSNLDSFTMITNSTELFVSSNSVQGV